MGHVLVCIKGLKGAAAQAYLKGKLAVVDKVQGHFFFDLSQTSPEYEVRSDGTQLTQCLEELPLFFMCEAAVCFDICLTGNHRLCEYMRSATAPLSLSLLSTSRAAAAVCIHRSSQLIVLYAYNHVKGLITRYFTVL